MRPLEILDLWLVGKRPRTRHNAGMITYKVVSMSLGGPHVFSVVAKESGIIVAGPFPTKNEALAEANLRASAMPGNRVES